jgi:hypothetical protein
MCAICFLQCGASLSQHAGGVRRLGFDHADDAVELSHCATQRFRIRHRCINHVMRDEIAGVAVIAAERGGGGGGELRQTC